MNQNISIILQTKLFAPPTRPKLVSRPRLIAKLNAGLDGKLSLISAPAGFGKTTLVTDWLSQTVRPFVWVSLDEDDNDLTRFFTYVAAAIQQIDGVGNSIQGLLQASQSVPPKVLVSAFINDCTPVNFPFILIFDDYHTITGTAANEAVAFLLDNLPPQLHLVITSRTDPLLPVPRMRAGGQVTELRTDDLRFTAGEAASFLQQVMGLKLSAGETSALETRTEGWIAGLQMAALSIQGLMGSDEIAAFVADFTGSHRYIFDYLTDEVLRKRPPDTQAFLLQTSLLDRLNASLCTAVTGQKNSQAILQAMDRSNLFLFPLDEKRQWYRYHHLFADLLHQRLQQRQPELIPDVYQRASQWYKERGEVETAIQYALVGEDIAEAARLLDKAAFDIIGRSELRKLHKLLESVPEEAQSRYPRLNLARAWLYMFFAEYDTAEKYLRQAEVNLEIISRLPAGMPALQMPAGFPEALVRGNIATIRAYSATRQGYLSAAVTFSNEALAWLEEMPEENARQLRGTILIILGQTQIALDEVQEAETTYRHAIEHSKASGRIASVMAAYACMMNLQRQQGQLIAGKATGLQGLKWLRRSRPHSAQLYPAEGEVRRELGSICYETNQLDEAKEHLARGQDVFRYTNPENYANCLHLMFLVELAGGQFDTAVHIQQQIEPILSELPPIPYRKHAANRSERIRRLSHIQPETVRWPEEMRLWLTTLDAKQEEPINTRYEPGKLIQARVLAALGQPEAALSILNQLVDAAEAVSRFGDLIQYRVQQALVLNRLSQRETAVAHLGQAVTLAESNDYLRTFLDEAAALRPLLFQLPATPFRDKLISLFDREIQLESSSPTTSQVNHSSLMDPLSKRELEVLRLLPTGQTGPQIAGQLYLSNNTVKTHIKNIYSKLNVNSRAEAIERAQTLGLIP
jgi:LuxR family maltose regulon positive regulatory protein